MAIQERTVIPARPGKYNLPDYEKTYATFRWESVEKELELTPAGKLNMAYHCVDRHVVNGYGDKTALHYIDEHEQYQLTFADLKAKSDHYATILQKYGVKKGDPVYVFLPKHPDCYISILAIIKLGAIAVPLFEAFMEEAIRDRILDSQGKLLITNQELAGRVPKHDLPSLTTIMLTDKVEGLAPDEVSLTAELAATPSKDDIICWVDRNDGLIMHYTSGSTGKPKGVIHAHRVMIQQYQTGKWVLDLQDEDIYWCTAHPGWVTGSSYGIFAPWLNRATIVVHGGRFKAEEWYRIIEQCKITVWYSAPTAFRMLKAAGKELLQRYNLSSLRHILSVGEPLNPEIIFWGLEALGQRIHDTWWMTETGGQLIVNLPSQPIKPGSMGRPFPGIQVEILDDQGNPLPPGQFGHLAVKANWPSLMKGIWNNPQKYAEYFPFEGWYVSGDLAYKDEDGYIFFQGRGDDIINSSGERIGPFEVESKLIEHPAVAEAGVIGKPDEIRGEIVKAFIVLNEGYEDTPELRAEIASFVKQKLAAHAAPREIEVLDELPKTKISGKIMRRVLKQRELEKSPKLLG